MLSQVPENEGLDSDTLDSPLPEFMSNPDIRFEVSTADRDKLRDVLDQLRFDLFVLENDITCFCNKKIPRFFCPWV